MHDTLIPRLKYRKEAATLKCADEIVCALRYDCRFGWEMGVEWGGMAENSRGLILHGKSQTFSFELYLNAGEKNGTLKERRTPSGTTGDSRKFRASLTMRTQSGADIVLVLRPGYKDK